MYTKLDTRSAFQPVVIDMLGPINDTVCEFLSNMAYTLSLLSGDDREASFLFQRLSNLIQRFNAVLPHHDSFVQEED